MLSQKVMGTTVGMWLLIPEMLRLGTWDLLKSWTCKDNLDFEPRIALQMVNEAAMCINRVRKKNSLGHQGFQLANGMGRLVTDEQAHRLLDSHTIKQTEELLVNLGIQRQLSGHFQGGLVAIDPHRILSTSKRVMAKKRKDPESSAQKMLQTFFCVCPNTGQPIMATMSSTGMPTTMATKNLIQSTQKILQEKKLFLADKEHFTQDLVATFKTHPYFELITPMLNTKRTLAIVNNLEYKRMWAGYGLAETSFVFDNDKEKFRIIAQRCGEKEGKYGYKSFITTSCADAIELITENYNKRWSVEEFFRFENEIGLNRSSTMNLNIRYGKLAMSLIAQSLTYQLRMKLEDGYRNWDALHLANEILAWSEGDIRAKDDTIIVTFYGSHDHIKQQYYKNLPKILESENINPKIPWLFDFKIDFRFK